MNIKIFGKQSAATLEMDLTSGGQHTIAMDLAPMLNKSAQWQDKVRIQVMLRELPDLLATALHYQSQCQFNYHGANKDKGYRLLFNESNDCILSVIQGDKRYAVSLSNHHIFDLVLMIGQQIAKNHSVSYESVLATCKAIANQ